MVYRNTKPESPKGQIYTRYASEGKEAALAHGRTLDVDERRILRWFEQWGNVVVEEATPHVIIAPRIDAFNPAPTKPSGIKVKWTNRPVKLIARGDQQSEVKWLDTGSTQAIATDQIKFTD